MRLSRSVQNSVILLLSVAVSPVEGKAQQISLRTIEQNTALMRQYQPTWPVPLVTAPPGLAQVFRFSYVRQIASTGNTVNNFLNGKGLCVISSRRTELDINLPNYQEHNSAAIDGFGDMAVSAKYRIFSGNETHGNYILSLLTTHTWASGRAKNGAPAASNGLMLLGGKGFNRYNLQSGFGATLPMEFVSTTGRPLLWNTTFQAHMTRRIWLDLESNSTFFKGGANDGKKQHYITPGVILANLKPHSWGSKSPFLVLDCGMQMATTHYLATNHNLLLDAKLVF